MALLRVARNFRPPSINSSSRIFVLTITSRITRVALSFSTPTRTRGYATKAKKEKTKATSDLVPGSKQPITDPVAQEEYAKCEAAMKTAVEWYRKDCAAAEARASGRVTPAMLAPVRVKLPDDPKDYKLEEVATVGVRDGTTLLISLFEENTMKHVEKALNTCNIPGVIPHKHDNRTIKIPIPKPTVQARTEAYTAAKRKAEEMRVQIRKHHQASVKRGKYEKHSVELEEFQKLTDRYIGEIDKIIASLQKATGAK